MSQESLNDRAVVMLMALQEAARHSKEFNDYGEATGFCDEREQLQADAVAAVNSIWARSLKLTARIKAHKKAKEIASNV